MLLIRKGDKADFEAYVGGPYPPNWCVDAPEGLIADADGWLVAIALVTIDEQDRTWVWFHQKTALSAVVLHRKAVELLDTLNMTGRKVHAFVDLGEPKAEKWFLRLGFRPLGPLMHPSGEERLAWIRG